MASWRFKRGSWGCVDHLHALLAKFGKDLMRADGRVGGQRHGKWRS